MTSKKQTTKKTNRAQTEPAARKVTAKGITVYWSKGLGKYVTIPDAE